jgi:hypothetical protein
MRLSNETYLILSLNYDHTILTTQVVILSVTHELEEESMLKTK